MEINNSTLHQFRQDFKEAVRDLEIKYNVSIGLGPITYDSTEFHGKLEVQNADSQGPKFDNYVRNLYPSLVGKLGRTVVVDGKRLRITGCSPSRRRYDIEVLDLDKNKPYLYSGSTIARGVEERNGGFKFGN